MNFEHFSIIGIAKHIIKTINKDNDFIIAITGHRRKGKSTLAWHLATKIDRKFHKNLKERMIFIRHDLLKAIYELPPKSVVVIDEAIMMWYKRDFARGEQKELNKIIDVCGNRNLVMIFNIPVFWDLDRHGLGVVRYRIHVDERGKAYVFKKSDNPFISDPWFKDDNENACKDWDKSPNPWDAKGYMGDLNFPDMPEWAKAKYIPLQAEKKAQREREEMEKSNPVKPEKEIDIRWQKRIVLLSTKIKEKYGMSYTESAEAMNMTQADLSEMYVKLIKKPPIEPKSDKAFKELKEIELLKEDKTELLKENKEEEPEKEKPSLEITNLIPIPPDWF